MIMKKWFVILSIGWISNINAAEIVLECSWVNLRNEILKSVYNLDTDKMMASNGKYAGELNTDGVVYWFVVGSDKISDQKEKVIINRSDLSFTFGFVGLETKFYGVCEKKEKPKNQI